MNKNENNYAPLIKTPINVLSLFDGLGGAYLALKKAGFMINKYYSSEIDKYALAVQQHHYGKDENFIQLGDVRTVDFTDILSVDLVIFGSPCTQLSAINSKDRTGLEGKDSSLFFEALRILKDLKQFKYYKHCYFLLENVSSMTNENRDRITTALLEIYPETQMIKIDSSLVAGAHRRRLYWSNIPKMTQPPISDVKYQDVIENGYVDREKANVLLSTNVTLTNGINRYLNRNIGNIIYKDKEFAELSKEAKLALYPVILSNSGYIGKSRSAPNEYDYPNGCYRLPSVKECERLMNIPDGYVSDIPNISKTEKLKMIGNSFTVDVIAHLIKPLHDIPLRKKIEE